MEQPATQNNFGVLHKSETTPGPIFVHIAQWQNRQKRDPRRGPLWSACQGGNTVHPRRQLCQNLGNLRAVLCEVHVPADKHTEIGGMVHVIRGLSPHDLHIGSPLGMDGLSAPVYHRIPFQAVHVPPVMHKQPCEDCQLVSSQPHSRYPTIPARTPARSSLAGTTLGFAASA